jgi:hypothetical protein
MSNTPQLGLPLLDAAQAQKHVTVNDALVRIDAHSQLRFSGIDVNTPASAPVDGETYALGSVPVNAWAGYAGQVAVFSNGGWVFAQPAQGWVGFDLNTDRSVRYLDNVWISDQALQSAGGASTTNGFVEFDHDIIAGNSHQTLVDIPASQLVIGVTSRLTETITGTLTDWSLGVAASPQRYGNGLGLAASGWVHGIDGTPRVYWSDTPLELTASGGDFAGGKLRITLHTIAISPPNMP